MGTSQSAHTLALLSSFNLPHIHKAGNELNLILMRNCTIENALVTPPSIRSLLYLFYCAVLECPAVPTPAMSFRNLKNFSSEQFSTMVSSLPFIDSFRSLQTYVATDNLCSTLSSCLDSAHYLVDHPAPNHPWLTITICKAHRALRAAERRWYKSNDSNNVRNYHEILTKLLI